MSWFFFDNSSKFNFQINHIFWGAIRQVGHTNRSTQIPFEQQLRVFIRENMLNNYTKSTSIIKFRIIFYINGGV